LPFVAARRTSGQGAADRDEYRPAAGAVEPPSDVRTINYSGVIGPDDRPQPRYKPTTL